MKERIASSLASLPATGAAAANGRAPYSDYDLNRLPRPHRALTPAAVLVPLVERGADLHVLLTQRTSHLRDHPGQISFPGGRIEKTDGDPVAAALRETEGKAYSTTSV